MNNCASRVANNDAKSALLQAFSHYLLVVAPFKKIWKMHNLKLNLQG